MVKSMAIGNMYCDKGEVFLCSRCGSKNVVIDLPRNSKSILSYLPKISRVLLKE